MINVSRNIAYVKKMQQQNGMTFVEVLIALVIIITGILGSVAMQATAKQASFDAMQRSLASSLAEDIVARMRASVPTNLAAYVASNYGGGNYAKPVNRCNTIAIPACNANQVVVNDQFEWELALMGGDVMTGGKSAGGLVNAIGCIVQNANTVRVVVSWQGRNDMSDAAKDTCGVSGSKRRQVVLSAFIF